MKNNEFNELDKELTEEQKTQLKALEKRLFWRTIGLSLRNVVGLILATIAVAVIDLRYVDNNPYFLFAAATLNSFMFIRQIRLDFLAENEILAEELAKIFKIQE